MIRKYFLVLALLCNSTIFLCNKKYKEYPIVSINNNNTFKDPIISKNFHIIGLQQYGLLNYFTLKATKISIRNFFFNVSKYKSDIYTKFEKLTNLPILKLINFNMGNNFTTNIREVNITGTNKYYWKKLISKFKLNRKHWFVKSPDVQFNTNTLIRDKQKLHFFYYNHGYLESQVYDPEATITPDKKDIDIHINIFEGEPYKIGKVFFDNENLLNKSSNELYGDKLENIFHNITGIPQPGETYKLFKIIKIAKKIKHILAIYGYIYANISKQIFINRKNKTVEIRLYIRPGKQCYVNKIEFAGNSYTKDSTLRKEIKQSEKTVINSDLILQDMFSLINSNLIYNVTPLIKRVSKSSNKIDITYQVKESIMKRVSLKHNILSSNPKTSIQITDTNFMGTGRNMMLEISKHLLIFLWNNPHLLNNTNINFRHVWQYHSTETLMKFSSPFWDTRMAGDLRLCIPISKNIVFSIGGNYFRNILSNIPNDIASLRYLATLRKKPIKNNLLMNDFKLYNSITFSNLNNTGFPFTGNYVNLDHTITLPLSDNSYRKINLTFKHYFPLSKKYLISLLASTRIGYLQGIKGQEAPFYEHYFMHYDHGAPRGFNMLLGPKMIYRYKHADSMPYPLYNSNKESGGNAMASFTLEALFPIPYMPDKFRDIFRTSIFIDAGTIWDSNWKNTHESIKSNIPNFASMYKYRVSTGLQLQCKSPIGLITLAFIHPLVFFKGDKTHRVEFHFGNFI
ncbi:outer membrane protein assembly factor BamA [Candidatus Ishikawella capsulata]|uniref:Outer membrane protein assembly factor BamA n=1 Tax=Candidatus Ishikawaella capsulata Mpkobe TaxID=476281 RepID=C5WCK3_9ENTR|nr:outer membrane protein assembly factor BamA [Candidatus Ishikawaella capsulata]BAH83059.1 hypothetical protein ICMP_199 [Candidatus Ishikawaella capsulata Mpkobe]